VSNVRSSGLRPWGAAWNNGATLVSWGDAERREIAHVLGLARRRLGGTLVLIGEAGIGKTAPLRQGAAAATDLVLAAAGTEAEVALPFAGLSHASMTWRSNLEINS
jgi:hypothetical protein